MPLTCGVRHAMRTTMATPSAPSSARIARVIVRPPSWIAFSHLPAFPADDTPYTIGLSPQVHRKRPPMPSLQSPPTCSWSGVLPAVTTQFDADLRVDLPATRAV